MRHLEGTPGFGAGRDTLGRGATADRMARRRTLGGAAGTFSRRRGGALHSRNVDDAENSSLHRAYDEISIPCKPRLLRRLEE